MIIKLLTEHHLEFLSLKGGCRGSSESTLVKMSNCWKSHARAQFMSSDSSNTLDQIKYFIVFALCLRICFEKRAKCIFTCNYS